MNSPFGAIRIHPDPELRPLRSSAKFRGQRRYYRNLHREAERFTVNPTGWYDWMHWHADWPGHGNLSWGHRREHLRALFTMFRRLLAEVHAWPTPHQAWLQVDAYDSSQDAVYLHTASPNGSKFPYEFEGVAWDVPVPACLREFVTDANWQFGRLDDAWTHFVVRPTP